MLTTIDARPSSLQTSRLPSPRGPLSESVLEFVTGRSSRLWSQRGAAALGDPDSQLALWLLNCLDVAVDWEIVDERTRSLPLRLLHLSLESSLEEELQRSVPAVSDDVDLRSHLDGLLRAPSIDLAASAADHGADAITEVFVSKAPYLGFEADPHTLALARVEAPLKPVVAEIQSGEYGVGHEQTHAQIYRSCLTALGLSYAEALDVAPAASFTFANLAWLLGRSVRWRGASLGQLCLLELDSVQPCRSQVEVWDAAGLPAAGRRWYDVHVLADAEHEKVIRDRLIPTIEACTPWLVADAAFGATATWEIQQQVASQLTGRWRVS